MEGISSLPERTAGGNVPTHSGCVGLCGWLELLQLLCDHEETK